MGSDGVVRGARESEARRAVKGNGGIAFLVRSLDYGGAERQVVALARGLHARGRSVSVLVFYPGGPLQSDLEQACVPVRVLGKHGRWDVIGFGTRLLRAIREVNPEILHPYLDIPNLLAVLLRPFLPGVRVVWGVRASDMDFGRYDRFSRVTFRIATLLSRAAHQIIVNSWAGREHHAQLGFPHARMEVIPNGVDVQRFRPLEGRRRPVREEWGIDPELPLVGLVGRLDPMKDHPTFLRAARIVADARPDVRFICIGNGPEQYRVALEEEARALGLEERLRWMPAGNDMPSVYAGLDRLCSSSAYGEGFSNVIGEAMACGVPCIVTDVGDSARIVGDLGRVVAPRSPEALAHAMLESLQATPDREAIRRRIEESFSVEQLLDNTERALWATG